MDQMPSSGQAENYMGTAAPSGITPLHIWQGHKDWIGSVAWSPDGQWLTSGSSDGTVRLWNLSSSAQRYIFESHMNRVGSVVWSPDGQQLASGSSDGTIRLWNMATGQLHQTLNATIGWVKSSALAPLAWSPNGQQLAFGLGDNTVQLWSLKTNTIQHILQGHTEMVNALAWSPNGQWLASSADDRTVRLWNPMTGETWKVLNGHAASVKAVAWSPDSRLIASGSMDRTIRLWKIDTGKPVHILEGYTNQVNSVAWSSDGLWLLASSEKGDASHSANICIWRTDTLELLTNITGLKGALRATWHPGNTMIATAGQRVDEIIAWKLDIQRLLRLRPLSETAHYTNAKVVLVGDSGVGKSGLGLVLSGQAFAVTESTHSRHIWTFERQEVVLDHRLREIRETLLWDLAGQPGYRLIHQLHLDEVAVALVVFDAHNETDPFAAVKYWHRALRQAQRVQWSNALPLKKLLVAGRIDRGGIGVSAERIQTTVKELEFDGYFETSAREGWSIDELRAAIQKAIVWEMLPKVSSTLLFQQIKSFLIEEKQNARLQLSPVEDLYKIFLRSKDISMKVTELQMQFETCLGRMESTGLLRRLSFGNLVLLQPELLDSYASALVNFVRDEPDGLGSITEEQARRGDFRMPKEERIQDTEQEKLLLIAMIEDLLLRELILREEGTLVFPSQSTKEHPDLPDPPGKAAVFSFEGPVLNIYATLAVRLARSNIFKKRELWKNAITYTSTTGGTSGLYLRNIGEGRGDLTLFFDNETRAETRQIFEEFVHLHLLRRALPEGFKIRRIVVCGSCGVSIPDEMIQLLKAKNRDSLTCPVCDTLISLVEHELQQTAGPSLHVKRMDQAADNQREREAARVTLQGKIATGDFDVFLCYHDSDKEAVKAIGEQLKENGILPWLDEWELRPGLPWQRSLEQQIGHIKSAAVFVGKDGIGPWQQQELAAFLREFVNRNCPVIPVLLSNASQQPGLPIFLKAMTWVDFRTQEPNPIQRLLWGITGRQNRNERL